MCLERVDLAPPKIPARMAHLRDQNRFYLTSQKFFDRNQAQNIISFTFSIDSSGGLILLSGKRFSGVFVKL